MSTGQFLNKPARAGAPALVRFSAHTNLRRVLRLSVFLNLALGALAAWLAQALVRSTDANKPGAEQPDLAFENRNSADPQPNPKFSWSALESADYRTYITNLRSIGCPEQTIRDIILADVHGPYILRYRAIERRLWRLDPDLDQVASQNLHLRLDQLRDEEDGVIRALLGPESQISNMDHPGPWRPEGQIAIASASPTSVPLVFRPVNSIPLDQVQLEVINDLRLKFEEDLGPANQDVNNLAYRRRWQKAMKENNDLFVGLLGGKFFLDYEAQTTASSQ